MKSLDRYLRSVKWLLPEEQKQDIVAELTDEMRSQIEERENELGRTLNDDEVNALLARWGHPLLVARRYQPPRYLIGPVLYPLYARVLKVITLFYLLPWLLVWAGFVIFSSSYREGHPVEALLSTWIPLAGCLMAVITGVFALVERQQAKSHSLEKWEPGKPPAAPDPNAISRSAAVSEGVSSAVMLLWWLDILRLPQMENIRFSLAPVLGNFYWLVIVLYGALVVLNTLNLIWPRWTVRRAASRMLIDLFGLLLVCCALAAGPLVLVEVVGASIAGIDGIAALVNGMVWISLVFVGLSFAVKGVQDILRIRGQKPMRNWLMSALAGE